MKIKKILCSSCGIPLWREYRTHKFCDKCRHQRDLDSHHRWVKRNADYNRKYYLLNKDNDRYKHKPKGKQYFTCQCGKVLEKKPNQKYCPECRKKHDVYMTMRWARNNPDKIQMSRERAKQKPRKQRTKEENKAHYQKHKFRMLESNFKKRIMLDQTYVKKSLLHFGVTSEYATKEIIELQREQLKLKRKLHEKEQRNTPNINGTFGLD